MPKTDYRIPLVAHVRAGSRRDAKEQVHLLLCNVDCENYGIDRIEEGPAIPIEAYFRALLAVARSEKISEIFEDVVAYSPALALDLLEHGVNTRGMQLDIRPHVPDELVAEILHSAKSADQPRAIAKLRAIRPPAA